MRFEVDTLNEFKYKVTFLIQALTLLLIFNETTEWSFMCIYVYLFVYFDTGSHKWTIVSCQEA